MPLSVSFVKPNAPSYGAFNLPVLNFICTLVILLCVILTLLKTQFHLAVAVVASELSAPQFSIAYLSDPYYK